MIIDTQAYKYQLTSNNPLEKGYTHQKIFGISYRSVQRKYF